MAFEELTIIVQKRKARDHGILLSIDCTRSPTLGNDYHGDGIGSVLLEPFDIDVKANARSQDLVAKMNENPEFARLMDEISYAVARLIAMRLY